MARRMREMKGRSRHLGTDGRIERLERLLAEERAWREKHGPDIEALGRLRSVWELWLAALERRGALPNLLEAERVTGVSLSGHGSPKPEPAVLPQVETGVPAGIGAPGNDWREPNAGPALHFAHRGPLPDGAEFFALGHIDGQHYEEWRLPDGIVLTRWA